MSGSPNCGFSPLCAANRRMACSSPAISSSASSSSRFRGVARRRRAQPVLRAAHQLSDLAPDPRLEADRAPLPSPLGFRCRRRSPEDRRGTVVSVFNGRAPGSVETFDDPGTKRPRRSANGSPALGLRRAFRRHEIGVLVRSDARASPRAQGRGQTEAGVEAIETHRTGSRSRRARSSDRHVASGEGFGVSRRRGHGLRRCR